MDWNEDELKEVVIDFVRNSNTLSEVSAKVSAHLGEVVSKDAVGSAWRRWREKDKTLPLLKELLGVELDNPLILKTEEPPKPRPVKIQQKLPNPRNEVHDPEWDDMPFTKGKVYSVIVLPDLQVPYEDKVALKAVEAYMADEVWDEYINMGDYMDFDCISSYNEKNLRAVEGKKIFADYEAGNAILDRHQSIVRKNNKNARFVMLEGNHDFRMERYIDEHPQLRGMLEVDVCLKFKERGFKFVRCFKDGEVYKLGKAYFHHGLYTNQNHAKTMVDRFGVNIFYGHVHDVQLFSKVTWGKDKTIVGQSLGCLCDYEQSYIKQNPSNWQHAFATFFFDEDGHFSYYITRIFNGRFIAPNGKVYDGNV